MNDLTSTLDHQKTLLSNLQKMLERLQDNMGNSVFDSCLDEIQEIRELSQSCESLFQKAEHEPLENTDALAIARENTIRLNILQQRIAGKVMKMKVPSSDSN